MSEKIFKAVTAIGEALKGLEVVEQQRVLEGAAILLGLSAPTTHASNNGPDEPARVGSASKAQSGKGTEEEGVPPKAARWMAQNKISLEHLEEIFHIGDGEAELILAEMPGRSLRLQTQNCYLLSGILSLLASGEPTVTDADVVTLCKKYKCYDTANHATYRKQSGNYLAGDKDRGFVLSAPGLRAAAEVIREASAT